MDRIFYGKGSGKGWMHFYCILTVTDWEILLNAISCNIFLIDDTMMESAFYLSSYNDFFMNIITRRQELTINDFWGKIKNIRVGFGATDSSDSEPLIRVSPFFLSIINVNSIQEKISSVYFDDSGNSCIGVKLSYPTFVTYWDSDDQATNHSTSHFRNAELFKTMTEYIKKISHKAKVKTEERIYRSNFWITQEAAKYIMSNIYLKEKNINIGY